MPRLYRPHIPLSVRVEVAARQLRRQFGKPGTVNVILRDHDTWSLQLAHLLFWLAKEIGCEVSDLHLDHDPALENRPKTGEGRKTVYDPPANDPEHLFYRPYGAEFAGSHYIKTHVRGEHGQYSDTVLAKRERRRQKREAEQAVAKKLKKNPRNRRSAFPRRDASPLPKTPSRAKFNTPKGIKRPWPKRPFPKGRGFERKKR